MRRHGTIGRRCEWEISTDNRNWFHFSAYAETLDVPPGTPDAQETVRHDGKTIAWLDDDRHARCALTFGNGNSDPVWALYFTIPVPECLGRRLER